KYETIKTFILIILIATSLLLSVGIWSYQPNYEQIQDMSYVNQVDIGGEEMSKSDLIKPSTIIFDDGNSFYGFNNSTKRSQLFEDISSWVLYDFTVTEAQGRPSGGHL